MSEKYFYHVGSSEPSIYEIEVVKEEIDDTQLVARYSEVDSGWTESVRGKEAGRIIDHGNGIILEFPDGKMHTRQLKMDYSQAYVLVCLLDCFRKDISDTLRTKIRKTQSVEEI
jgi:hypothetical protein